MAASQQSREHAVERAGRIYRIIATCAERREPCPTNTVLAARFSVGKTVIVNALHLLESCGMISVERKNDHRIVTVSATGQSTTKPERLPAQSWRARKPKGAK